MATQYLILVVFLVASIHRAPYVVDAAGTAYDVLEQNNLPRGLLPQGVTSYNLSPEGKLDVNLPGECNFLVAIEDKQYKFRYAATVGGVVSSGSIHEAYGVRLQVAFDWLGISQVDRSGDQLAIQAQEFNQSFPVSAFTASPVCS
ncbi:hypothetical protein ACP4OV_010349 [Aristida adscensionis]